VELYYWGKNGSSKRKTCPAPHYQSTNLDGLFGCIKTRNRLVKTQQKFILCYVLTVHKERLQRKTTTCFGQL
jgi:hypothetical protein